MLRVPVRGFLSTLYEGEQEERWGDVRRKLLCLSLMAAEYPAEDGVASDLQGQPIIPRRSQRLFLSHGQIGYWLGRAILNAQAEFRSMALTTVSFEVASAFYFGGLSDSFFRPNEMQIGLPGCRVDLKLGSASADTTLGRVDTAVCSISAITKEGRIYTRQSKEVGGHINQVIADATNTMLYVVPSKNIDKAADGNFELDWAQPRPSTEFLERDRQVCLITDGPFNGETMENLLTKQPHVKVLHLNELLSHHDMQHLLTRLEEAGEYDV